MLICCLSKVEIDCSSPLLFTSGGEFEKIQGIHHFKGHQPVAVSHSPSIGMNGMNSGLCHLTIRDTASACSCQPE